MYEIAKMAIDNAVADPTVYGIVNFALVIVLVFAAVSVLSGGGIHVDLERDDDDDE